MKKVKNRIAAFILAVAMLVSFFPTNVKAEEWEQPRWTKYLSQNLQNNNGGVDVTPLGAKEVGDDVIFSYQVSVQPVISSGRIETANSYIVSVPGFVKDCDFTLIGTNEYFYLLEAASEDYDSDGNYVGEYQVDDYNMLVDENGNYIKRSIDNDAFVKHHDSTLVQEEIENGGNLYGFYGYTSTMAKDTEIKLGKITHTEEFIGADRLKEILDAGEYPTVLDALNFVKEYNKSLGVESDNYHQIPSYNFAKDKDIIPNVIVDHGESFFRDEEEYIFTDYVYMENNPESYVSGEPTPREKLNVRQYSFWALQDSPVAIRIDMKVDKEIARENPYMPALVKVGWRSFGMMGNMNVGSSKEKCLMLDEFRLGSMTKNAAISYVMNPKKIRKGDFDEDGLHITSDVVATKKTGHWSTIGKDVAPGGFSYPETFELWKNPGVTYIATPYEDYADIAVSEYIPGTEPIPYETERVPNIELAPGEIKTINEGKIGKMYTDGTVIEEKEDSLIEYGPEEIFAKNEIKYDENLQKGEEVTEVKPVAGRIDEDGNVLLEPVTGVIIKSLEDAKWIEKDSVELDLPFSREVKDNEDLLKGEEKVIQEGKPGKIKETTFIVEGTDFTKVEKTILEDPVPEIIEIGTRNAEWIIESEKEVEVAYQTETKDNPELEKGQRKVVQEGKPGVSKEITYKLEGTDKTKTETVVVTEPVTEIIAVGTKEAAKSSDDKKEPSKEKWLVEEEKDITVKYKTETREDFSLEKGKREVIRSGVDGITREITYKLEGSDRTKKETKVIREPVNEIVRVGTKVKGEAPATRGKGKEEKPKTNDAATLTGLGATVVLGAAGAFALVNKKKDD